MEKILVSACLLGQKVRYHGDNAICNHDFLDKWLKENRIVSICPEVSAGLSIPRPPSEIQGEGGGVAVLSGKAKVITLNGDDRTEEFLSGAKKALNLAILHKIKIAILKSKSPSCGNTSIYDGTHSRKLIAGMGTTAALLHANGVKIFNETQIDAANYYLINLENN